MKRALTLFLLAMVWGGFAAGAAMAQAVQGEEGEFHFPKGKNRVRIPFKLIHNLIIIPVQINNSQPFHFVVDTGVDKTILIEVGLYDSLELNNVEYLSLKGLGNGDDIGAMLSKGNQLRFAGVEAHQQEILVLEQNIFDISSRVGMEVNGIIGYSLFKDFIVEIDYGKKVLSLYRPGFYPARRARKAVAIPLEIQENKPYVQAEIFSAEGESQPIKLIVDSGMSSSVLLYPGTLTASLIPDKTIKAFLGRGLNGEIHGDVGRVKAFKIGDFVLANPTASFPDSVSIRHALLLNNRNGNLGADILHRFRVVFDYRNAQMLLMPNYKFKRPFHFNLTGIELVSPIPGQNVYTVASVIPGSPAYKAGLKPGDSLIGINGESCFDKTLDEILTMFQTRPGRSLRIKVSRDLEKIETSIKLKDII